MAKIYVDTTRLYDFYGAAEDNVQLEELQTLKSSLVITEQTLTEFRRNRVKARNELSAQLNQIINGHPPPAGIIRHLQLQKEFTELFDKYRKKGQEILAYLKELIASEDKDPCAQIVLGLRRDEMVTYIKLTEAVIPKAHQRKLLGNPPSSSDKYTIGDEVIWELLLANMKDDLIIVTSDKTYEKNLPLLRDEYEKHTGRKLLLVTQKLSEAIAELGQQPTPELMEAEKKEEQFVSRLQWIPVVVGPQASTAPTPYHWVISGAAPLGLGAVDAVRTLEIDTTPTHQSAGSPILKPSP
jgi:hypothetical protein